MGSKAVHGHSLWIEPCECREACRGWGGSLNARASPPSAPASKTSLQHEVVSSTLIRPCSRELLPGTLSCCYHPSVGLWMDTRNQAFAALLFWGKGAQRRPGQLFQNALARAMEGTLLIVIILVVRFSPVGFIWWQPFSLPSFFPFSFPITRHLHTYLVPCPRAWCFFYSPLLSCRPIPILKSLSHSLDWIA